MSEKWEPEGDGWIEIGIDANSEDYRGSEMIIHWSSIPGTGDSRWIRRYAVLPSEPGTVVELLDAHESVRGQWWTVGPHGTYFYEGSMGYRPEELAKHFRVRTFKVIARPYGAVAAEIADWLESGHGSGVTGNGTLANRIRTKWCIA